MQRGRVFMDLWDCERFYPCERCGPSAARLHEMNLTQTVLPRWRATAHRNLTLQRADELNRS